MGLKPLTGRALNTRIVIEGELKMYYACNFVGGLLRLNCICETRHTAEAQGADKVIFAPKGCGVDGYLKRKWQSRR